MKEEVVKIGAQRKDGGAEECSLSLVEGSQFIIRFSGFGLDEREFSGRDLYDALRSLRLYLETEGISLLCAGSRKDATASGMSRSMSGGRKIYITKIGIPASSADLVDIFDFAPAETLGTVEEQETYRKEWFESLR